MMCLICGNLRRHAISVFVGEELRDRNGGFRGDWGAAAGRVWGYHVGRAASISVVRPNHVLRSVT